MTPPGGPFHGEGLELIEAGAGHLAAQLGQLLDYVVGRQVGGSSGAQGMVVTSPNRAGNPRCGNAAYPVWKKTVTVGRRSARVERS